MSRMNARDMASRVTPLIPNGGTRSANRVMPSSGPGSSRAVSTVEVPKGGEVHVRKIDGGHIVIARDKNYSTKSETFVKDTSKLVLK